MRIYILGDAETYRNYQRAVEQAGGTVQFGGESKDCDALLLPGGGDMEPWRYGQSNQGSRNLQPDRDEAELELLNQFTQMRKPVLGICRGLQVINVFFGGTLIQDLPGHSAIGGTDRYHRIRTEDLMLQRLFGRTMIVNSAHHQAIDRVGADLMPLQWAADGTMEAIRHKELPVWAFQWHPERMGSEISNGLFRACLVSKRKPL